MALKRIGQILTDLGLIDDEQLEQMLAEQEARGGELLGRVGVSLGFYSDEQLGEALAEQWNTLFVTLYDRQITHNLIEIVSRTMAEMYRVVPLELKDNRLTIATADPQKIQIADELRVFLGYDIGVVVATDAEIDKYADLVLRIPDMEDLMAPVAAVVPLQLLAYHVARMRGHDIDQPRNLAKSVTVE